MNIIDLNFFNLSFSSQIKILELCLKEIKGNVNDDEENVDLSKYDQIFEKYKVVVEKLLEFKYRFSSLNADDRKKMRELIDRYKDKINYNNAFDNDENFYCDSLNITDSVVNDYINKGEFDATEFLEYYSYIFYYKFEKILELFRYNKDYFNDEIEKLSDDFYPLYIKLNTVDRMKCIWYLANFEVFSSDKFLFSWRDEYPCFLDDDTFIKPMHKGSKVGKDSGALRKHFKCL